VKPIDPNKPGTYVIGKWQYTLQITGSGTRSEGRSGWLLYDGQKLPRGDVNDYVRTPWGPIYWVGVAQTQWGLHGWMLFPSRQTTRVGREMNSPAGAIAAVARAPGQQPPQQNPWQEIVRTDNGKRIRAPLGRYVLIRLPGNPTTGFRWQTATLNGQSVRLLGEPQYVAAPAKPGVVGTGGTFFFKFQAVQPGATTIKLVYVRPWDKDRGPADAFACTVEVMSPQPLPPARAIRPVTQN
jgi:inhibitor of cysteine peptidase